MTEALDRGQEAFARGDWAEAHRLLTACGDELPADALEALAIAANLVADDPTSDRAWQLAAEAWVRTGDLAAAASCTFWLGFMLLLRGSPSLAQGWLAKAARLAAGAEGECAARGWLQMCDGFRAAGAGDLEAAGVHYAEAARIARLVDDVDLLGVARLGQGEVQILSGDPTAGLATLDEVMVDVVSGAVSAMPAGIIYCAVIDACVTAYDYGRAAEWTDALTRWTEGQPGLVAYRGTCLVHRAQILQARGDWPHAAQEMARAREVFTRHPHPAAGAAHYQSGELYRVSGDLTAAEAEYRAAAAAGMDPAPGLALLRLAQGRRDVAADAAHRMLDTAGDAAIADVCAEVLLAVDDLEGATRAVDVLDDLARRSGAALLAAIVERDRGALALKRGDAPGALALLRSARRRWASLAMPYEAARTDQLIAAACRLLDDGDGAAVAEAAAHATLAQLGADVDVARLLVSAPDVRVDTRLTERERDVLRAVAGGSTNRAVGAELGISEHTVARHLQNIFTKLGLSSRAAATAYAYEHDLL